MWTPPEPLQGWGRLPGLARAGFGLYPSPDHCSSAERGRVLCRLDGPACARLLAEAAPTRLGPRCALTTCGRHEPRAGSS